MRKSNRELIILAPQAATIVIARVTLLNSF
jgi:hypothetical protein